MRNLFDFILHCIHLDMLGDASSNVHMQYLREGVLMTEAEESKLNQNAAIRVRKTLLKMVV